MGRKKIDVKLNNLIERCVMTNHRALCLHLGPKARDQVVLMYHILQKVRKSQSDLYKPTVLWCFKKDDKFSFIKKKLQKTLKKKCSGEYSLAVEDCFEYFLASTDITFCHFSDTSTVLGQTFGMLVIQDFQAVTPNILARTVECVEGGGIISILLPNVQTLEEIPSLKLDAHSRYVTSAQTKVDPVFNYRFVLSLPDCINCMVLDDSFHIHLLSSNSGPPPLNKKECFKFESKDSSILNQICALSCTKDQADALLVFIHQLKEKCTDSVVSLTSARGRGKSATLGLATSAALLLKFSTIYITSPQLDNVQTFFSFIIRGIKMLNLKEGKDYNIIHNSRENKNLVCEISLFRDHKQIVCYLPPTDYSKTHFADLIVIDEAAAIPLPIVKEWLKFSKVFMASTINGYEGTGRSLSLKLLNQLRERSVANRSSDNHASKNFTLHEITLNQAIRYSDGDGVEAWLNTLFCLNSGTASFLDEFPKPESCELYYVNKSVLFSYHQVAEAFLQQLVSLFVSSHYKNSPNDLLMMADAPSHHLFCLLAPVDKTSKILPRILCVIQIALEGKMPKNHIIENVSHGKRASGDLIPWIISQQFQNNNFPMLSGARIVRIATHPNYQRMGYGQYAVQQLFSYYAKDSDQCLEGKRKSSLLLKLHEMNLGKLDYIGVSYGLTLDLLRFWKKLEFVPLYLRQTASEITGEHSCIMIKGFEKCSSFLREYAVDFLERFVSLLSSAFKTLPASASLEILHYKAIYVEENEHLPLKNSDLILSLRSLNRLEAYCEHLVDYHLIMDLIPTLARNYFLFHFKTFFLSSIQEAILLCIGLQHKPFEEIALELNMETNQIMGLFTKVIKKILPYLTTSGKGSCVTNSKFLSKHQDSISYEKSSKRRERGKRADENDHKKMKFEK